MPKVLNYLQFHLNILQVWCLFKDCILILVFLPQVCSVINDTVSVCCCLSLMCFYFLSLEEISASFHLWGDLNRDLGLPFLFLFLLFCFLFSFTFSF